MNAPARWFTALAAAISLVSTIPARAAEPELGPNSNEEPLAESVSLERAAGFLDTVAGDWTRERRCGTCHTNYAYLISRPALKLPVSESGADVRAFFEGRVAGWDDASPMARPRWDAEVVATAAALAINDALTTGKLHPRTRQALDRMWTRQREDGSWDWLKCDWPPYEQDDYYGAVFAAVGIGYAPDSYRKEPSAQPGIEKLKSYLTKTPAPSLHHKAFLLWASTRLDGLMTDAARSEAVGQLRALQRKDGGWNLPSLGDWSRRDKSRNDKNAPSDGYGTGFVVFVLRQAGCPADDPAIQRGVAWLKANQRESGRWFTRSLNNDDAHYITHAGTGFAVLALDSCGVK